MWEDTCYPINCKYIESWGMVKVPTIGGRFSMYTSYILPPNNLKRRLSPTFRVIITLKHATCCMCLQWSQKIRFFLCWIMPTADMYHLKNVWMMRKIDRKCIHACRHTLFYHPASPQRFCNTAFIVKLCTIDISQWCWRGWSKSNDNKSHDDSCFLSTLYGLIVSIHHQYSFFLSTFVGAWGKITVGIKSPP